MKKPDVDYIHGISPAVAIEQKVNTKNPRSTVGTSTEIYDYLRLLFARIGKTFCPNDGTLVRRDTVQTVMERLAAENAKRGDLKFLVLFPLIPHENASVPEELENLKKNGFFRIMYKDEILDVNEAMLPEK